MVPRASNPSICPLFSKTFIVLSRPFYIWPGISRKTKNACKGADGPVRIPLHTQVFHTCTAMTKSVKCFCHGAVLRLCRVLLSPYAGLRCSRISACHDVFCCQRNPVNVYYTSVRKNSQDDSQPAFQLKLSAIRILSENIV